MSSLAELGGESLVELPASTSNVSVRSATRLNPILRLLDSSGVVSARALPYGKAERGPVSRVVVVGYRWLRRNEKTGEVWHERPLAI